MEGKVPGGKRQELSITEVEQDIKDILDMKVLEARGPSENLGKP